MNDFELHFNKVPEENKKNVLDVVNKDLNSEIEKFEGEYEKNEEEIKAINVINDLLKKEILSLGLEPKKAITEDRIHFID